MHRAAVTIGGAGGSTRRGLGPWRAWWRCVLVTGALFAAIFVACTVRLVLKNSGANPTITQQVLAHQSWFCLGYSARVLAGYLLAGLLAGSFSWLLLWSWSTIGRRGISRRGALWLPLVAGAVFVVYKLLAYSVYSPQILENACSSDFGVGLIAALGGHLPAWLVPAIGATVIVAACTLVGGAAVCAITRLERRPRLTSIALLAVSLICATGLGLGLVLDKMPKQPRRDGRPNILILATDGLRADHLGLYGYDKPTSPNIDRLGGEAVRCTACYVPQARTLPSWTSMFTGTYPHTHGQRYTWPRESRIKLALPTLCRELRKKGYQSSAFSDWAGGDFAKVDYGFNTVRVGPEAWSIRTWIAQATCQGHPFLMAVADNSLGQWLYPGMDCMPVNPNPEAITEQTVEALEKLARRRQPFFMVAFYSETHLPYATRYPYYRMFSDPAYQGRHRLSVYMPTVEHFAGGQEDSSEYFDAQQVRALYDGAIRSFDDQVGEIVAALKEFRLWDDTIVIITSDHGEELLETPYSWGHGRFFFGDDVDNRIPLVVSDPELRGRGGRAVNETMSSLDLMPTLLERVGGDIPATCEGRSLLGLLRGQRAEQDTAIFAESSVLLGGEKELDQDDYLRYPPLMEMLELTDPRSGQVGLKREYLDLLIEARHRMIRTSEWKLVYLPLMKGARYALYNVRRDPQCLTDVQAEYPQVFEGLKRRLWEWMERDPLRCPCQEHMVPKSPA